VTLQGGRVQIGLVVVRVPDAEGHFFEMIVAAQATFPWAMIVDQVTAQEHPRHRYERRRNALTLPISPRSQHLPFLS
jgi:hypothetical protein